MKHAAQKRRKGGSCAQDQAGKRLPEGWEVHSGSRGSRDPDGWAFLKPVAHSSSCFFRPPFCLALALGASRLSSSSWLWAPFLGWFSFARFSIKSA